MSLYERLQEIKKVTGWPQERISIESGISLSTISRLLRYPGYQANETTHKLINQLYAEYIKHPFPAEIENLFNIYDVWKEQSTQRDFILLQDTLEFLLIGHRALHDDATPAGCRIAWLIGHIYYDRAFYLKNNREHASRTAIKWYEQALDILKNMEDTAFTPYKYKLQQCIVAVKFNLQPSGKRTEDPEIRRWLIDIGYIESVTEVVKENDWNWLAARNGLIAASILQDWEKCQFFWQAMQKANKRFADLAFSPVPSLPALGEDPDLSWFVAQIRHGG